MGRKFGKHCLKKYKKRDSTPNSTSSSSSSLSEEEGECTPFKTTQIFIGAPPPGVIAYPDPGTCSSGGLGDRPLTQKEWCSKFCDDGQGKRTSQDQDPSNRHEDQGGLSNGGNGKVIDDGSSMQSNTMTREEWCRQFCVAGHARRGGNGVPPPPPPHQHLQPHSSRGKPHQNPKVVCLPGVQCCGGCRGGEFKDGTKYKKPKGDEGPMTPAQQYTTFLQAYALAAAVMMGEPPGSANPRPRQREHQGQQQAGSHPCRDCP